MYCNTKPSLPHALSSLQYNTCIAIQFFSTALHILQYPAIQFPSLLASLIAIQFPILQYNFSSLTSLVAIQILVLQYNYLAKTALQNYHVTIQCLYCDTISMCKWAVAHLFTAPKKKNFSFFFLYSFFFSILFPATRNTQKKYPSIVFFLIFHPIHQIISYKFIFFIFFCFPHYKTLENDFLPLIFFFIILTQIYKNLFYSLFFNFTPCKTSENIFFISKPNKFIKI